MRKHSSGALISVALGLVLSACGGGGGQPLPNLDNSDKVRNISTDGGNVVVTTSAGRIANAEALPDVPAGAPAYTYPVGFLAFDIEGLSEGQTVTLTVELPAGATVNTYVKCAAACLPFAATAVGNFATLSLTDGGAGDKDGVPNGVIQDPGAPAFDDSLGGGGDAAVQAFFTANVQPHLAFCRTCHIDGGVADTAEGERFLLLPQASGSPPPADDYAKFSAAWIALDRGVAANKLLTEPTLESEPHSGGKPWPVGSPAYAAVRTLLTCWDTGDCTGIGGGGADPNDLDGDGVPNASDNCPQKTNPQQQDRNSDGVGDVCDLLDSKHARHRWDAYCEGKPDSAALPEDPRTIVRKENADDVTPETPKRINIRNNVYFNAWWEDCHDGQPKAAEQNPWPTTCGDFRVRRNAGLNFFRGLPTGGTKGLSSFRSAADKWGTGAPNVVGGTPQDNQNLLERMYTLRYGWNPGPTDLDTYLDGDDDPPAPAGSQTYPVAAGVTGTLPLGMRYPGTGTSAKTGECFTCHGGRIGDPFDPEEREVMKAVHLGMGNNNYDVLMAGKDNSFVPNTSMLPVSLPPLDPTVAFNLGIKQRGQNNAVGAFELLMTLLDFDTLGLNPNPAKTSTPAILYPSYLRVSEPLPQVECPEGVEGPDGMENCNEVPVLGGVVDNSHPLAHTQDTPQWWNYSSRPRKFFDAGVSNDSTRIIMAAGDLGAIMDSSTIEGTRYRNSIETHDHNIAVFFLSLRSPEWPESLAPGPQQDWTIDEALAAQGAILFHTKDLWAEAGNAGRPKPPGGNGSCASCHGAYAAQYVTDADYLEEPALEGVAGHISPLHLIDTDHARSDMLTPTLRKGWDTTYWAYPETHEDYKAPEDKSNLPIPFFPLGEEQADDMQPRSVQGACGWEKEVIGYLAPPLYGVWATAPYFHNGSVPSLKHVLGRASDRPVIWQRQLEKLCANGTHQTDTNNCPAVVGFDQRLKHAFNTAEVGWNYDPITCAEMPGTEQINCSPVPGDQGPSLFQLATNFLNGTISLTAPASIPDPAADSFDKRLVYDTRILGNGKGGHEFTDVLTDEERAAIIEYLKTL